MVLTSPEFKWVNLSLRGYEIRYEEPSKNSTQIQRPLNRMPSSYSFWSRYFGGQMINREGYPVWRNTTPVPVDADTLQRAERLLGSCESCTPDLAEIPFDYVLDVITGCNPEFTDYVLTQPARCPRCGVEIQTGYWRWYDSQHDGRKVFILPGTLVTLK